MAKYSYLDSAFRSLSTLLISFFPGPTEDKVKDLSEDALLTPDKKYQILCNYTKSVKEFNVSLEKHFKAFRLALESEIKEHQTKGEYLFLLNGYKTEILTVKNKIIIRQASESPIYSFENIIFTDIPEGYGFLTPIDEVDYKSIPLTIFSERIQHLSNILDEADTYISNLIDVIVKTLASELQLKPNLPPKPSDSSVEEPLKFFNHFIINNGFIQFKNDFFNRFSGDVNHFHDENYNINLKEESFTYINYDENEFPVSIHKVFFKDELNNLLEDQLTVSINFLDKRISELQTASVDVSHIINSYLSNCLDLSEYIKKEPELVKYTKLLGSILAIGGNIVNKYSIHVKSYLLWKIDPEKYKTNLPEKLIWTGRSMSFMHTFLQHYDRKLITVSLEGDFDMENYYKRLLSFFDIMADSSGKGTKKNSASPFIDESTALRQFREVRAAMSKSHVKR